MFTPPFLASTAVGCFAFFGAINLCFLPVIYFYYIETAGRSLEEVRTPTTKDTASTADRSQRNEAVADFPCPRSCPRPPSASSSRLLLPPAFLPSDRRHLRSWLRREGVVRQDG